jgi:hypothetical protein
MIYNQERHIQLLKRSQDFNNQGKSFYKESPAAIPRPSASVIIRSCNFLKLM